MKIVIVGGGKIGSTILSRLVSEKHEVVIVDNDISVIQSLVNAYDVIGVCANATEYEELKNAGTETADLFIAVTGSDELNMLSCFLAKRMGAKHTIARIRESTYNTDSLQFIKNELSLSQYINPEKLTAHTIFHMLRLPVATKVERFGSRDLKMIELVVKDNSPICGKTIAQIRKSDKEKYLICYVLRGEELFIPKGNFTILASDKIGVVTAKEDIRKLMEVLGEKEKKVRSVIIIGAGITALYLAKILEKNHYSVKVIEKNEDRCLEFCSELSDGVTVIHGDGMNQELLIEEGMLDADGLVALTGKDEKNILISSYAVSQSVDKVICKVNRDELVPLADKMGIDTIVSPRKIIADSVVSYARALQNSFGSKVEMLYSLQNGKAEALEFIVNEDFEYCDIPLKNMQISQNVLVGGIIRNGEVIIPDGNEIIKTGDKVVVICSGRQLFDLADIVE